MTKRAFIFSVLAALSLAACEEPAGPSFSVHDDVEGAALELEPVEKYNEDGDGDLDQLADTIDLEVGINQFLGSIEEGADATTVDDWVMNLPEDHRIREIRFTREGAEDLPISFLLEGPDELSLTTDGTELTESFVPRLEGPAEFVVTIEATNLEEAQPWSVEVDVDGGNNPPSDLELSATSVAEDAEVGDEIATITATDDDPAETFTFTEVDDPDDKFAVVDDKLVVDGALDHEAAASHEVTIEVADTEGATYQETFVIDVDDVNEAPTADAGPDATVLLGEEVTLDGSGSSDPDEGDALTGSWDLGDGNVAEGLVVTHTYASSGMFTATLTVTDQGGLSDSDEAVVTVQSPAEALADFIVEVESLPITPDGLLHSFEVKPENALRALERGDTEPAMNLMGAFINHVMAQAGKAYTQEDADMLIAMAQRIIDSIAFMEANG